VDPLTKEYPWYTPYQFAGNRPIVAIDIDGLEPQEHPYQLPPIGKVHLGVTNEGKNFETYQVNSPTNGKTWVTKIIEEDPNKGWYQRKPIDHFMYYDKVGGWKYWQRGDDLSIETKQIIEGGDLIGKGVFWTAVGIAGAYAGAGSYTGGYVSNGLRWVNEKMYEKYIDDFITNAAKKYIENEGKADKIDWFDVTVSTINPFKKIKMLGVSSMLTETVNSLIDYKEDGGWKATFLSKNRKSSTDFLIDFGIGQFKSLGKNTFKTLGGKDAVRDDWWDIGVNIFKGEGKKFVKSIKQNIEKNKSKDEPTL
jgi:hypothetical protein